MLLDERGRIVECNDQASRSSGLGELAGAPMFMAQRLAAASRSAFGRSLADAARGGVQVLTQVAPHTPAGETAACWDLRISGVVGEADSLAQCAVVLIDQSRLLLRQDQLYEQFDRQALQLAEVHTAAPASASAHARIATRMIGELQEPLQRVARFSRSLHDVSSMANDAAGTFARSQIHGIIAGANAMLRIVADLGQVVQGRAFLDSALAIAVASRRAAPIARVWRRSGARMRNFATRLGALPRSPKQLARRTWWHGAATLCLPRRQSRHAFDPF